MHSPRGTIVKRNEISFLSLFWFGYSVIGFWDLFDIWDLSIGASSFHHSILYYMNLVMGSRRWTLTDAHSRSPLPLAVDCKAIKVDGEGKIGEQVLVFRDV